MAAEKGRGFVLLVSVNGTLTQVGGLQTNSFTINNETVDVTNKGSAGFRTLLEAGGVGSLEMNATGLFDDDAAFRVLRNAATARTHLACRMAFETGDTLDATFAVGSLQVAGEYNGAVNYNVTLQSSGAWTYSG